MKPLRGGEGGTRDMACKVGLTLAVSIQPMIAEFQERPA
jgi:hypothetical protein